MKRMSVFSAIIGIFLWFWASSVALAVPASSLILDLASDTATMEFEPSSGTVHYSLLGRGSGDSTYVYGSYLEWGGGGSTKTEKLKITDPEGRLDGFNVYEVRLWARMKATSTTPFKVQAGISSNGVFDYKTLLTSGDFKYYFVSFLTDPNPNTEEAWTPDAIDPSTLKVQFRVDGIPHGVYISECWMQVIYGSGSHSDPDTYLTHGPIFGGVTGESEQGAGDAKVKIFARANGPCNIKIRYGTIEDEEIVKGGGGSLVVQDGVDVDSQTNFSCIQELTGLDSNETYYFNVDIDEQNTRDFELCDLPGLPWHTLPQVTTFPDQGSTVPFSFCWGADTHDKPLGKKSVGGVLVPEQTGQPIQPHIWERIASMTPAFFIHVGDWHGGNHDTYDNLSWDYLSTLSWEGNGRHLMEAIGWRKPFFGMYSDHDFVGNNSDKTGDCEGEEFDADSSDTVRFFELIEDHAEYGRMEDVIKLATNQDRIWSRHEVGDIIEVSGSTNNDGVFTITRISPNRKWLYVNGDLTDEVCLTCNVNLLKYRTYNARDALVTHRPTPDLYVAGDITGVVSSGDANSFIDTNQNLSNAEDKDKPWPGCMVWNLTDGSYGIIESIDSLEPLKITLTEQGLKGGGINGRNVEDVNKFIQGDSYRIGISGMFYEFWYGDVQFLVLDTRYKRDPNGVEYNDMLDGRHVAGECPPELMEPCPPGEQCPENPSCPGDPQCPEDLVCGPDESNGTRPGHIQRDWLVDKIGNSEARMIFVLCEMPFNATEKKAHDKWADYEGDGTQHLREYIISQIGDQKDKLIWLSGDRHFSAVNYDGSGDYEGSDIPSNPWLEACASPLAGNALGVMHTATGFWGIQSPLAGAFSRDVSQGKSDETEQANDNTEDDMTLLPDSDLELGDGYLFGGSKRFRRLWIKVGDLVGGVGNWTLKWKYSEGDGQWSLLDGVADETTHFHAAGLHQVTWDWPWFDTSWQSMAVQGVEAYWVRAQIDSCSGSVDTQPLGTQAWIIPEAVFDEVDFPDGIGDKRAAFGSVQVLPDGRVAVGCEGEYDCPLTDSQSGQDLRYLFSPGQ